MRQWSYGLVGAVLMVIAAPAASVLAAQTDFVFKQVPSAKLLAVKVDLREGYAPAFGKLVQFYLQHQEANIQYPQMTVGREPEVYAAIAFTGKVQAGGPVQIIELPAATVAEKRYKGAYGGLRNAVIGAIKELKAHGVTVDMTKTLRMLYRNSPDNTPPAELVTDIQIPVLKH